MTSWDHDPPESWREMSRATTPRPVTSRESQSETSTAGCDSPDVLTPGTVSLVQRNSFPPTVRTTSSLATAAMSRSKDDSQHWQKDLTQGACVLENDRRIPMPKSCETLTASLSTAATSSM